MSNKNNTQDIIGALNKTYTSALNVNTNVSTPLNLNKLGNLIGTSLALNSAAANMYGVNVKWFRSIPQERSKDVIFLEWTLYNVEDCPLNLNVIHTDSGYDEATLTYNMMGIEYNIPLTMSISILDWERETKNDGSIPSKNDIVYIPQSNRLYEVVSMTPQKTVASQITYYKVNLQKYQPKSSRFLGENLSNTIDNYTNSVEKLFGEDIQNEIKDAINDKQLSPHNSTYTKDKYKILFNNNSTIIKDIICDGHVIAKSYYENSENNDFLVKYKNINDHIGKNDERTFSCLFSLRNENKIDKIKNISFIKKTTNHHLYKCFLPYNCNCKVSIGNDVIQLYGDYNYKNKELKIKNSFINIYGEDWYEDNNIYSSNQKYNLLTSDNFSIDIIGNYTYVLYINDKEYSFISETFLEKNKWYNIIFSLGKNTSIKIYNTNNDLELLFEDEIVTKKWGDFINDNYYIKGNNSNISNIRLYNSCFESEDKYILNAITYLIEEDSKLIISDNVDAFFANSYYENPK